MNRLKQLQSKRTLILTNQENKRTKTKTKTKKKKKNKKDVENKLKLWKRIFNDR